MKVPALVLSTASMRPNIVIFVPAILMVLGLGPFSPASAIDIDMSGSIRELANKNREAVSGRAIISVQDKKGNSVTLKLGVSVSVDKKRKKLSADASAALAVRRKAYYAKMKARLTIVFRDGRFKFAANAEANAGTIFRRFGFSVPVDGVKVNANTTLYVRDGPDWAEPIAIVQADAQIAVVDCRNIIRYPRKQRGWIKVRLPVPQGHEPVEGYVSRELLDGIESCKDL